MRILQGARLYHSMFGLRGVYLAGMARLSRKPIEIQVAFPGVAHPVHLRVRTTDVAHSREILVGQQYDCELARDPRVILDAGANIGLASVYYANKYPHAKIISVEPEPSNFAMLQKNTAAYPNVAPLRAALWNKNTSLALFDPGAGHSAIQTRAAHESQALTSAARVSGITVEKLMADFGLSFIDVLKIDIEGAEMEVFESVSPWISRVGVIAIELHDFLRPGCRDRVIRAANGFDSQWQKGETTYFARKEYVANSLTQPISTSQSPADKRRHVHSSLPLKILAIISAHSRTPGGRSQQS